MSNEVVVISHRRKQKLFRCKHFIEQKGNMKQFGKVIREKRKKAKISLMNLADRIRISSAYLCRIERGNCPPPSEEIIKQIAKVLKIDPDQLMNMAGKISSELVQFIVRHPQEVSKVLKELKEKKSVTKGFNKEKSITQLNLFN